MVKYDFTLYTKYSLYLDTQNKNYPTKLPKPKSYLSPNLKKKKITGRGFGVLMVVGGLYNKGGDPLNFSFSLFQMFCQSQVFYFGNI